MCCLVSVNCRQFTNPSLSNLYVELHFESDVEIEANWSPVIAVKSLTPDKYQFYFGQMRKWYDSRIKFDGVVRNAVDSALPRVHTKLCKIMPFKPTGRARPSTGAVTPTTSPPTTTAWSEGCVDIDKSGAKVMNSWNCRSCLQVHVNFELSQQQVASLGSLNDISLELWFTENISQ